MYIIKIDETMQPDFLQLEHYYYEMAAKKEILAYIISNTQSEQENNDVTILNSSIFQDFVQCFQKYDLFKKQFQNQYLKPRFRENSRFWEANFNTNEIYCYD